MLLQCLPSSFGSIPPTVWEEMSFEVFLDGHHGDHLEFGNTTILAILSLYNSPNPPVKFQLNLTLFGIRCRLKNFKMATMLPSWISEWNDFSNSESLCQCDVSHQVLAQSNFQFGRRCRCHLGYRNGTILAILILCVTVKLPIKFWLNPTYGLGGDVV